MAISEARRVAEYEQNKRHTILFQEKVDVLAEVVKEHHCRCGAEATLGVTVCPYTLKVVPIIEYCTCDGNCGVHSEKTVDTIRVDILVEIFAEEYLRRLPASP